MDKEKKQELVANYGKKEGDTGSTEVQVAFLTQRINELTTHMVANKHDFASQRGLLKMVGQRRRLLAYLGRGDAKRYHALISKLGLRK